MKPVTRQKVNIAIDIIMFVVMVAVAVIGFIMRYILIPGSERWIKYGRNVDLTCWGLDRHEWGLIHLILGLFLVFLLALHIIFHWALIGCLVKRLFPNRRVRLIAITGFVILSCVILLAPFYLSPETGDPIRGQGEGFGRNQWQQYDQKPASALVPEAEDRKEENEEGGTDSKGQHKTDQEIELDKTESFEAHEEHKGHEEERILEIKGFHTIWELANTYDISTDDLKKKLGIPSGVSNNERLGRIRRVYGFTMSEVEDCILALQKSGKK